MDFVLHNIAADTTNFLLVIGKYNGEVCRGFNQPCVVLTRGWFPSYANLHPFAGATRIELVISREVPNATIQREWRGSEAATEQFAQQRMREIADSANPKLNAEVVRALAMDSTIRDRAMISNAGVFQIAQERFRARADIWRQQAYLKHFQPVPKANAVQAIEEFCKPIRRAAQQLPFETPWLLPNRFNPVQPAVQVAGSVDTRSGEIEIARVAIEASLKKPSGSWDVVDELQAAETRSLRKKWAESQEVPPVFDDPGFMRK